MDKFLSSELIENIKRLFSDIAGKLSYINNPGKNVLIKAFSALIAILAAISLIFVILEAGDDKPDETTTSDESMLSTSETSETSHEISELKSNILFCLKGTQNNIRLLFLLQLDNTAEKLNVIFLEPTSVCETNNMMGNMNFHIQKGGVTQLIMAVERYTSFDVNRYVVGDEKALTSFVRTVGDVEINVRESISYNHEGLSYIIDDGKQVMTPDSLLKYIIYLSDNREENMQSVCEFIAVFAQKLFDCNSSQTAQDNFDDVVGYFDTNISAMDFSENKAAVMELSHDFLSKLRPINNLSELQETTEQ